VAADLDLLVGLHSRQSHSIGAAALVFAASWLVLRGRPAAGAATALALSLSYASHILLDFFGSDTTPPLGIMALWPFSSDFYLSPVALFMGISRRYWLAAAWAQNARSVAHELLVMLPLAGLACWLRWRFVGVARDSGPAKTAGGSSSKRTSETPIGGGARHGRS
jgi:inner membrane protein